MTSLYHNLPTLEAAAQEIGPTVDRLLQRGEQSERAASALLEQIEAQRPQVDALAGEVERALAALAEEAERARAEVEASGKLAEAATDGLQQELRHSEQELAVEMERTTNRVFSLGEVMGSSGRNASEGEDRAAAAAASLEEGLSDGGRSLEAAVDGAEAAGEGLQRAVNEARSALVGASAALGERMRSALDFGRERLAQAIAAMEGACQEHLAVLEHIRGKIEAEAGEEAEHASERMHRAGVELDAAYDLAEKDLADFALQMDERGDALRSAANALVVGYSELLDRVGPLQAGVDAVKRAASQVGLDWP